MCCCWRHRAAELHSLQSQSMCTALLLEVQGYGATGPAVTIYANALLLTAQGCRATEPAVTVNMHFAFVGSAGGWRATGPAVAIYIKKQALLLAAQGCRATEPAVTVDVHCAAVSSTGLQSHGTCSHNLYTMRCRWRHRAAELRSLQSQSMCTALLLAVQDCRATGPAVAIYMQMLCSWRHKAAELWASTPAILLTSIPLRPGHNHVSHDYVLQTYM